MLKLKKIAVTGSLGAGKTSVCELMSARGAFVIDTDGIVHHLLASDFECIQKITNLLGQKVRSNNHINRKLVAEIVFSDPDKLSELEKILHPKVLSSLENAYEKAKKLNKYSYFVAECPLLFEIGWEKHFDVTILVKAPENQRMMRFIEKGFDKSQFVKREQRLLDEKSLEKNCDFVITNSQSTKDLEEQVENILSKISENHC